MLTLSVLHVAAAASAAVLPITTTFNGDMIGAPPRFDQPGQPDSMSLSSSSLIYVVDEVWRLRDQPVRLSDLAGDPASLTWNFQAVNSRLRVEISMAVDSYLDSPALTLSGFGMPAADLSFAANGWLMAGATPVGQYNPREPFRVRMELDPVLGAFSVAIDNEFNGFGEDVPIEGLLLSTFGIASINRLEVRLDSAGTAPALVAFDDISITINSTIGSIFCTSLPTSSGSSSRLQAEGTASVTLNKLTLRADSVPVGQPGLFFYGPDEVSLPFGNGIRCVSGPAGTVFRIYPYSTADVNGLLTTQIDNSHPTHAPQLAQPGATWKFQAWFRDSAAGGVGFNLSDGITVTLEP